MKNMFADVDSSLMTTKKDYVGECSSDIDKNGRTVREMARLHSKLDWDKAFADEQEAEDSEIS